MNQNYIELPVNRVFLRTDNPRFVEPSENEEAAIAKLCAEEDVLRLAKDIAEVGLNPMDIAGVMSAANDTYVTGEGNRRFCALKLLNDPDRAPSTQREAFQKLADKTTHSFDNVLCYLFEDEKQMKAFIRRMHSNYNGAGRRRWSTAAQEREFAIGKNALAVEVNTFAKKNGVYKKHEKEIDVTTLQRWANKSGMKAVLGVENNKSGTIRFRSVNDTKKAIRALFNEIFNDENPSRRNKDYIEIVASQIQSRLGFTAASSKPKLLSSGKAPKIEISKEEPTPSPPRPPQVKHIAHDAELYKGLQDLEFHKLASLYYSLTKTKLKDNVPMLSVTAWSIIECLTVAHGSTSDFRSYLNKKLISDMGLCGLGKRDNKFKKFDEALDRISRKGNATKHEVLSGGFDPTEIATDIAILTPLLKILVSNLIEKMED